MIVKNLQTFIFNSPTLFTPKQATLRTSKSIFHQQNRLFKADCSGILKKDPLANIDRTPERIITQIHP